MRSTSAARTAAAAGSVSSPTSVQQGPVQGSGAVITWTHISVPNRRAASYKHCRTRSARTSRAPIRVHHVFDAAELGYGAQQLRLFLEDGRVCGGAAAASSSHRVELE
ncbi:hypothetical protein ACWCQW_25710 [Streptomyces mirabilis]